MRRSKTTTTNNKRTRGRIALSGVDPPASQYLSRYLSAYHVQGGGSRYGAALNFAGNVGEEGA